MSFKFLKKGNTVCLWQLVSWPVSHFWDIWSRNSFRFTYYLWYTYLLILYILHYGNSKAIMSISHFLLISWLSWILALILKKTRWFLMHVICRNSNPKIKNGFGYWGTQHILQKKNTDHNALIGFWFNSPVHPQFALPEKKLNTGGPLIMWSSLHAVRFCFV